LLNQKKITPAGLLNLFVVYIVWSSTYLAIRIGIRPGAGFEPFYFGGLRVLTAGLLLLLWGLVRRKKISLSKEDLITLAGSGFLLWIGGNGLVVWAEKQVDSGFAALILSSIPIWVVFIDTLIDSRISSMRVILSLFVGFLGILTLSFPLFINDVEADLLSIAALIIASISWSSGLVLQTRRPVALSQSISSGYQQLFGGIFFLLIAVLVQEPLPRPTPEAWLSLGYLIIFGSLIAFTSFVSALQLLPTRIVTTYAYVNPV
jgi:drug/metabolite transporter (DMT)-like permease